MNRSHPLAQGLVCWYKVLPEMMGGRIWRNLVSPRFPLTLTNMETSDWQGPRGSGSSGCLNFGGTDEHGIVAAAPLIANPMTLACMVRPANITQTMSLVNIIGTGANYASLIIDGNNEYAADNRVVIDPSGTSTAASSAATYSAGEWIHAAGVCNSNASRFAYLNGQPGTANVTNRTPSGWDTLVVGAFVEGGTFGPTNALMDDVMIWSRALAPGLVRQLVQELASGCPSLLNRSTTRRFFLSAGGGGITADVPVATITFSGVVPGSAKSTEAPIGALTLTGVVPGTAKSAAADVGLLTLAGVVPATSKAAAADVGTIALAGVVPGTSKSTEAPIGSVLFVGLEPAAGGAGFAPLTRTIKAVGVNGGSTDAIDTTNAALIVLTVAFYSGSGGAATVAVDDSEGNDWEPGTIRETANGEESVQLFYCIGPTTSATHTFEATGTGGFITLAVEAFTATGTVAFVSESTGGVTNSGTSVQPGELTATQDGSLFVTGLNYSTRNTASINSSFTAQSVDWVNAANIAGAAAYKIQGTAGPENPTWSWSGAAEGAASMMLFRLSGGITADVEVGTISFAGVVPGTAKSAVVEIGAVTLTGVVPSTSKAAAVDSGSITLTGVVPGTAKTCDISPPTSATVNVSANGDDATFRQDQALGFSATAPDSFLGDNSGIVRGRWDRFASPGLVQGQAITSATLTYRANGQSTGSDTLTLTVWAEAADASVMPVSTTDVNARTMTAASTLVPITLPHDIDLSVDVTLLVREVISRPGYAGGAISFKLRHTPSGSEANRRLDTLFRDDSVAGAAELLIVTSTVPRVLFTGIVPSTATFADVPFGSVAFAGVAPTTAKSAAVEIGLVTFAGLEVEVVGGIPHFPGAVSIERVGFICSIEQLGFACTVVSAGFGGVTMERRST